MSACTATSCATCQVRFDLYENDVLLPLSHMSGVELAFIAESVQSIADSLLCVSTDNSAVSFHAETLLVRYMELLASYMEKGLSSKDAISAAVSDVSAEDDESEEEDPSYGLLQCRVRNQCDEYDNPIPAAFPTKLIPDIYGKSYSICPRGFDSSKSYHILFYNA